MDGCRGWCVRLWHAASEDAQIHNHFYDERLHYDLSSFLYWKTKGLAHCKCCWRPGACHGVMFAALCFLLNCIAVHSAGLYVTCIVLMEWMIVKVMCCCCFFVHCGRCLWRMTIKTLWHWFVLPGSHLSQRYQPTWSEHLFVADRRLSDAWTWTILWCWKSIYGGLHPVYDLWWMSFPFLCLIRLSWQ